MISSVVPCDQHSILWSAWTRGESKVVFYNSRHSLIVTSERSGNRLRSKPVFAWSCCSDHQIRWCRFPLQVNNMGWGGGNIDSPWSDMNISLSMQVLIIDITHYNLLSLYCRRVLKLTLIWIKHFIFRVSRGCCYHTFTEIILSSISLQLSPLIIQKWLKMASSDPPARLWPGSALLLMDKDYVNAFLCSTQLLAIKIIFRKLSSRNVK